MPTSDDRNRQVHGQPVIRASYLNAIVARNIVRLRHERQLAQVELAERANMSRMTLVAIESGRRIVGLNDLPGLCMALECSMSDLMEGEPGEPAEKEGLPLGYVRKLMLPTIRYESIESALRRLIRDELLRP